MFNTGLCWILHRFGLFRNREWSRGEKSEVDDVFRIIETLPMMCTLHVSFTFSSIRACVQCYCSAGSDEIDVYGEGVCDVTCAGDLAATCGGYSSLAVYAYGISSPVSTPTSTSYEPLGCFEDNRKYRLLESVFASDSMTTEVRKKCLRLIASAQPSGIVRDNFVDKLTYSFLFIHRCASLNAGAVHISAPSMDKR